MQYFGENISKDISSRSDWAICCSLIRANIVSLQLKQLGCVTQDIDRHFLPFPVNKELDCQKYWNNSNMFLSHFLIKTEILWNL